MVRHPLFPEKDITEGTSRVFVVEKNNENIRGVVIRFQGRLLAYENRCQHLAVTLDEGSERFFSRDGRHLFCQRHGAYYNPLDGKCLRGPCLGAFLNPIEIEVFEGLICVRNG